MPISVAEKRDSREGTQGEGASTGLRYIIRGTDDDTDAKSALVAGSPALYAGLVRQSSHIERIGEDTWEGTVRYGLTSPPETGQSSFSFDTGGGSQHITQGRGTSARYSAPGKTAPNFERGPKPRLGTASPRRSASPRARTLALGSRLRTCRLNPGGNAIFFRKNVLLRRKRRLWGFAVRTRVSGMRPGLAQ